MDKSRARPKGHWFYGTDYQDADELNVVEFPLALLSRNTSETKLVRFADRIFDKARGEMIERTLSISANELTTLPNWWDQDALIALQVITNRRNRFATEVVEFTLYEVLKEMGLKDSTRNYRRLAASFDNWTGVLVKYSHWRKGDTWQHPKAFHIIQDYDLTRKGRPAPDQPQVFAWSRLFAESVRESNTKAFDSAFYFGLKSPTTKRLFRFMDKRLGRRVHYSTEFVPFCTDKLGLTRNCYPSEYPRKIKDAYNELVAERFLADITPTKRIVKSNGKTLIHFKRGPGRNRRNVATVPDRLLPDWAVGLAKRDVEPDPFLRSNKHKDYDFALAIEYWDWLVETKSRLVSKNPQGFLAKFVRDKWKPPSSYVRRADRKRIEANAEAQKRERALRAAKKVAKSNTDRTRARERRAELESLWRSIGNSRQVELEDEAMEECENSIIVDGVRRARREGKPGRFHEILWNRHILPKHFPEKA